MNLDQQIVVVAMAVEALVFGLILYRKVWKVLPLFSIYVVWSLISDVAGYLVLSRFPDLYNRTYVYEISIDSTLQFMVLVELLWSVLRPIRNSLPKRTPWILAVIVAVAGLLVWPLAANAVSPYLDRSSHVLSQVQETVSILRVGFFLVMASFSQILSIGWRDRELQVATGFGFYSIVSLLVAMLHSHQQVSPMYHKLDVLVNASYVCSLTYWVVSFATKEQQRKEFSPQMRQILISMSGGARSERVALTDLAAKDTRNKD